MQVGIWIGWILLLISTSTIVRAQSPLIAAIEVEQAPAAAVPKLDHPEEEEIKARLVEMDFLSRDFLSLNDPIRFSYINPMSSEWSKGLYSQNIPLVLFASAANGAFEPLAPDAEIKQAPYQPVYLPSSSTRWYVGDRLFAVDNSAFFGIEFDSSFAYRSGVVRIGDSSEKAVVILVSLYPSSK